jgi:hypothetical protein
MAPARDRPPHPCGVVEGTIWYGARVGRGRAHSAPGRLQVQSGNPRNVRCGLAGAIEGGVASGHRDARMDSDPRCGGIYLPAVRIDAAIGEVGRRV